MAATALLFAPAALGREESLLSLGLAELFKDTQSFFIHFSMFWAGLGLWEWSQRLGNGRGMLGGDDFQDLATILDPLRSIVVDSGPDRLSAT